MISPDGQDSGNEAYPWFALRVRSNYEKVASLHIRERGYEEFSPSYMAERQWSDRKKTMERPLFPGYVFCRLDAYNRLPILTIPGVVGLVGFGSRPTPVPDQEIEDVRTMIGSGLLVTPWPFLDPGQTVLIERGPLKGIEGVLQSVKGRLRLVVSINVLRRSVATEIDRSWVRPLKKSPASVRPVQSGDAFLSQM
ncbi:MAG: UpxY family transcription antiterminator [Acidobacteriia bacterium]|nr:UpxY family transcription antiterminator [Terriglobia bacterium]